MNLQPIPVGTPVGIRISSEYFGRDPRNNPADQEGVVIESPRPEDEFGGHTHEVRWLHSGCTNIYRRIDLKYWDGKRPAVEEPKLEPISEEELGKLNFQAVEQCLEKRQLVTARYAFIYKNRKIVVNTNDVCHYTAMSLDAARRRDMVSLVTCINRGADDNKGALTVPQKIKFYSWLFNRSPWANAFITKGAEECFKTGKYAVCDVSAPANMLQGALIATRQPWEHPAVVKGFCTLVDLGVPENTAFLLGSTFKLTSAGTMSPSFQPGGHFPLDPHGMTKEDCLAFVQDRPHVVSKGYNEGGECTKVHAMFSGGDWRGPGEGESLSGYCKQVVRKAGASKDKTTTNPFAAAKKAETGSVKAELLAKYVIEQGIFV